MEQPLLHHQLGRDGAEELLLRPPWPPCRRRGPVEQLAPSRPVPSGAAGVPTHLRPTLCALSSDQLCTFSAPFLPHQVQTHGENGVPKLS